MVLVHSCGHGPEVIHRGSLLFEFALRALHEMIGAAWPITAIVLVFAFRGDLRTLLQRMTKGPLDTEFSSEMRDLELVMDSADGTLNADTVAPPTPDPKPATSDSAAPPQPPKAAPAPLQFGAPWAGPTFLPAVPAMPREKPAEMLERMFIDIDVSKKPPNERIRQLNSVVGLELSRIAAGLGALAEPPGMPTEALIERMRPNIPEWVAQLAGALIRASSSRRLRLG